MADQINIPTTGLWSTIATSLNSMFDVLFSRTGWGYYQDTQYTTSNRFPLVANTETQLPNNKGNVIETQKPSDVDTFYDGAVITGRNGDDIIISIDFTVVPASVNTTTCEVWVDITGGTGTPASFANLYRRLFTFPKGSGVERKISFSHSGYTLGTFEANGGVVKVLTNDAAEVYDINYTIKRTHKAR